MAKVNNFIKNFTNQKNVSGEIFRLFSFSLGMMYIAATPPVNIKTVMGIFYQGDYKEAKVVHKIDPLRFEMILQYLINDYYNIFHKYYKQGKSEINPEYLLDYLKSKILEIGPERIDE